MSEGRPERMVFVGGAPRSGTTVAHALICAGEGVSPYNPEISFFRGYLSAWRNGRVAWDQHTSAFFDSPEAFRQMMRQSTDVALLHLWRRLGAARILALKDPHLTPLFPDLRQLYPDEAWFVTVCRHPAEVVRSRQEVHEKSDAGRPFGPQDAAVVAREYLAYYRAVLGTDFGGRHFMFRYEDLNDETLRANLAKFVGVAGFDVARMWGAEAGKAEEADAWGSPKYNKAIDLTARLSPLAPELAEVARQICQPVMQRMGYA